MAVPVDPDPAAALLDDRLDELDDRRRAVRRRVPDRVGDADALRAGPDRGRVQRAQRVGIGAGRVFRDVHDGQALADRERDRLLGQLQQLIERPPFGVLPQRARPDEGAALDRDAGALRDLRDRPDVGDERCAPRSSPRRSGAGRRSPAPGARRRAPRAARRPAGRCRPSRSRAGRSGAGSAASRRWSGTGPTATAARRAASRHRAGRWRGFGVSVLFQS